MKTAQQLAWLCTTFGVLKYGQVAYSEVVCGTIRFGVLHPSIRAGGDLEAYWLPLFIDGIVARGFPISPQQSEGVFESRCSQGDSILVRLCARALVLMLNQSLAFRQGSILLPGGKIWVKSHLGKPALTKRYFVGCCRFVDVP